MTNDEITISEKIKYVQDTLFVISGKWKLPVMMAVAQGNTRFRDILRSVQPISSRVLSRELKDLEENKLIIRVVDPLQPNSVTYSVSPYCKSLKPVVEAMIDWGKNHRLMITGKDVSEDGHLHVA